jgi:hypothetical protein
MRNTPFRQAIGPFFCGLHTWSLLICVAISASARADERTGEQIYRQECVRCHGAEGQGTKKIYPTPLAGLRSVEQLARFIAKSMPDDNPGKIKLPAATKVASYIFDAFYSPAAQARLKPPKVELARLTVRQYRNAYADLVAGYRPAAPAVEGDGTGLRGEYFKGKNRDKKSAIVRVDPVIQVDLGANSPDGKKLDANEFFVRWEGSVLAPETGEFEFQLRTDESARLWVNDVMQPLIDASVKSGSGTEYRGSLYLLAGRLYPVRLEFFRSTLGVRKEDKTKGPPAKAKLALEWKRPQRVFEPVAQRFLYPVKAQSALVIQVPLPPDDRSAGYERGTAVSRAWVDGTTEGAVDATRYIFTNLPDLSGVSDKAGDRKAKLHDFCRTLAERAFRRPLTREQQRFYVDHHFETAADVDTAVKRSLLLVFESPRFLYRELPAGLADQAAASYDSAARISFGLLDSLPDAELRRAAGAGELTTRAQAQRQAERLVKDLRYRAKVRQFLLQWLKVEQVGDLTKDAKRFPGFDQAAAVDLRASLELFLDEVISSPDADFRRLLLADYVYLNGRLAKFYKAELPGDAPFQKVAFNPDQRCGVLTHPYLMATFAYPTDSSPIHRGVFLARGVLGVPLRPPPDAFAPLAAELHPNLTTRERVSLQTKPQACQACHSIINPLGFILEKYDAIGNLRNQEKGRDIDPSGLFQTREGKVVRFAGVRDLAQFLSKSDEVQEAFVAQFFHHLVRQPIRAYGPDKLVELRRFFAQHDCNMRALAVEIIAQAAFPPKEEVGQTKTAGK